MDFIVTRSALWLGRPDEGRAILCRARFFAFAALRARTTVLAEFLCAAVLFLTPAARPQAGPPSSTTESMNHPEILFVQAASVKGGRLSERFPSGSRIVRLEKGSSRPTNLTPSFFSAADPRISFDGSKVLFAAKKNATANWQIWEMNTDGTGQRQVTHSDGNCLAPAYLPRGAIAFTGEVQDTGGSRAYQIYFSRLDGSDAHPITFGPGDYELQTVLQNGLILASARSPLRAMGKLESSRNLYTLRPDGSGLAAFRCDHEGPAIRSQAEELDDGSVVFVKNTALSSEAGGDLATIRRGTTHNSILGPASALIWSPRQLEGARLIVARRVSAPRAAGKFDLYSFDVVHGKFQAPIYEDSELSSIEAVPVAAHPAPRWFWSTLRAEIKMGYFICLDASMSNDAPKGRLSPLPTGVRVLTLDPTTGKENSLGEAPIEHDGSFYIAVPPDRPVRFELLGTNGKLVRGQQSWVWARPGEEHGCVGCHEDRAVAPENRWPLALRRFDAPTCLGVQAPLEAAH
ncbi:MAG TPA: hypothetical protein VEO19_02225 [Terriglobia bacterium]|nr:hypothetical protein [Terriglobia bacterium]